MFVYTQILYHIPYNILIVPDSLETDTIPKLDLSQPAEALKDSDNTNIFRTLCTPGAEVGNL